jgi:hypothetical protein
MDGNTSAESGLKVPAANHLRSRIRRSLENESGPARLCWNLLIVLGVVVLLWRGISTYSLFKGPVGVGYENAFGISEMRHLPQQVLNVLLAAAFLIAVLLTLRVLQKVPAIGFRILCLFVIITTLAQFRSYYAWGKSLIAAFTQYDLIIREPSAWNDVVRISNLLGEGSERCSIFGEDGLMIVRVPPRAEDRRDQVAKSLRQAGYTVETRGAGTQS